MKLKHLHVFQEYKRLLRRFADIVRSAYFAHQRDASSTVLPYDNDFPEERDLDLLYMLIS